MRFLPPPIAGERVGLRGGVEMVEIQYQTHMQAPKYDVQFLRSEALRSSSSSSSGSTSSSSRTRQIKECKIIIIITRRVRPPNGGRLHEPPFYC